MGSIAGRGGSLLLRKGLVTAREGVRRQVFVPNWGKNGVAFYVRTTMGSAPAYGALRNEMKT